MTDKEYLEQTQQWATGKTVTQLYQDYCDYIMGHSNPPSWPEWRREYFKGMNDTRTKST